MSEHKSCPFCGGEPEPHSNIYTKNFVLCALCRNGTAMYEKMSDAWGAWDRRNDVAMKSLEEALEDEHNNILRALTAEPELRIDYIQRFRASSPLTESKPAPAPAPDLETLVEKYFGQLTKATFDINVPVMQAFKDILRAFAAELGYKP